MSEKTRMSAKDKMEKAFFDFLEEKSYSKITVSELIERAGVSRTTFYRHYVDIFDMHLKISDKFANAIVKECFKRVVQSIAVSGRISVEKVIDILCSQQKYIYLLAGENGSRYFFESLYNNALYMFKPIEAFISEDMFFRIKFAVGAVISFYVKDTIEGRKHSLEVIGLCSKIIDVSKILEDIYGK